MKFLHSKLMNSKKKGFVSFEIILISSLVLLFTVTTVPNMFNKGVDSYTKITENNKKLVYEELEEDTGIYIENGSGESIHKPDVEDKDEIKPPVTDGDIDDGKAHVKELRVNPTNVTLDIGKSAKITVTLVSTIPGAEIDNKGVTWSTDNKNVAQVAQDGTITAIAPGNATITVRSHDSDKSAIVNVSVNPIPAMDIELNTSKIEIAAYGKFQLVATVKPADATDQGVLYSIEDESIASVNASGLVTGKNTTRDNYKTFVIVRCGLVEKRIPLEVEGIIVPTDDIKLKQQSYNVEVGSKVKIEASVLPTNATIKDFIYRSIDEYYATVDAEGYVTGQNEGQSYVNVCNTGADFFGKEICRAVQINVTPANYPLTSLSLSYESMQIKSGATMSPRVTYNPSYTSNKGLNWTSSNPNAVSVDDKGVVTGKQDGSSTITATSISSPLIKASFTIQSSGFAKHVESVSITEQDILMHPGDVKNLTVNVLPADATNKTLRFTTSDSSVATVDNYGQIIAIRPGIIIVTAVANDNGISASVVVNVEAVATESVSWDIPPNTQNVKKIELDINETYVIGVNILPINATDKTLTFNSTTPTIADYKNGSVHAYGYGDTTISVTGANGTMDILQVSVREKLVDSIKVDNNPRTIGVGEATDIVPIFSPTDVKNKNVNYNFISNETTIFTSCTVVNGVETCKPQGGEVERDAKVVSLDNNGHVVGLNPGTAIIDISSATNPSARTQLTVHVTPNLSKNILIKSLNPMVLSDVGQTGQILYSVLPTDTSDKRVIFTTGRDGIVKVDDKGKVTALAVGESDVYVIAKDNQVIGSDGNIDLTKSVYAKVHVIVNTTKISATGLTTKDKLEDTMYVGNTLDLHATVVPSNATQKNVTWSVSDSSIATVSPSGRVTALSPGVVRVVASHEDGPSLAFRITVKRMDITKFVVAPTELIISVGGKTNYTLTTLPTTVSPRDYNIEINDVNANPSNVISVDKDTKTITGLKEGTAYITFDVPDFVKDKAHPENEVRGIAVTVLNGSTIWDGSTTEPPVVSNNTCIIKSANNLAWVSKTSQTSALPCSTLNFQSDINLNGHSLQSIADVQKGIALNVEGNNHKVENGTITSTGESNGFISKLKGNSAINNFALKDITVKNSANTINAGILVGAMDGGNLNNVSVEQSTINNAALGANANEGFIIGYMANVDPSRRSSLMNVSATYNGFSLDSKTNPRTFGGLIGTVEKDQLYISATSAKLNDFFDSKTRTVASGIYFGAVNSKKISITNSRAINEDKRNQSLIGKSNKLDELILGNYYFALNQNTMDAATPVLIYSGTAGEITSEFGYYGDTNANRKITPNVSKLTGLSFKTRDEMFDKQAFVDTLNTAKGYSPWGLVKNGFPELSSKIGLTGIKLKTKDLVIFKGVSVNVPVDTDYDGIPVGTSGQRVQCSSLDTNIISVNPTTCVAQAGKNSGVTKIRVTVDDKFYDDMTVTSFALTGEYSAPAPLTPAINKALLRDFAAGLIIYDLPTPTTWRAKLPETEISKAKFNTAVPKASATSIKFLKDDAEPAGFLEKTDVSSKGDSSIIAYKLPGEKYEIKSNLEIMAPGDCSGFFNKYNNLLVLEFNNFNTANVTNMNSIFASCSALMSLDLSNFNTINVTSMDWMFVDCSSLVSLDVSSFNTINVTGMRGMFSGCSSLTSLDLSSLNTTNVENMGWMFNCCSSLTSLNLSNFNTTNVTNMHRMFRLCENLTSLNLSNFNTANVENMGWMFNGCFALISLDISNFNTTNVTNMDLMFNGCTVLTSLDVSNFDTRNVANMRLMFYGCSSLTSLNLSNFSTANVKDMGGMFKWCSSLTSLDLSNFNTTNVTDMSNMFNNCPKLTTTIAITGDKVTDCYDMFNGTSSVSPAKTTVNHNNATSALVDKMIATKRPQDNVVKGRNLDDILATSLTTSDARTQSLYADAKKQLSVTVNPANATNKNVTWSSSNTAVAVVSSTGNVTGILPGTAVITATHADGPSLSFTFNVITNKTEISKSKFNTAVPKASATSIKFLKDDAEPAGFLEKTDVSAKGDSSIIAYKLPGEKYEIKSNLVIMAPGDSGGFFSNYNNLLVLEFNNFNTTNVTNMGSIFEKCSALTSLDISKFNTTNVKNMSWMFSTCSSLTFLNLSNFNTTNVTDMGGMFYKCSSLISISLSNFNTIKVTNMWSMFSGCSSLTSLDTSNFNTTNVRTINAMFNGCSSLTSLDLSSFNTANVTDMRLMFYGCSSLTSLNLSNFSTANVKDMGGMFQWCSSLTSLNISNFNTANVTNMDYMFYNCSRLATTIAITGNIVATYPGTFSGTSSISPAKTIVNYNNATSALVDRMIATKGTGNNVVKGINIDGYSINYNLNGGTMNGQTNPSKYTVDTPTFQLKEPTRDGYSFEGWSEGNSKLGNIQKSDDIYKINRDTVNIVNTVSGNNFSQFKIQLWESNGSTFIKNIVTSNTLGKTVGEYTHQLATGNYILRYASNGSIHDDIYNVPVYFKKGEIYRYSYDTKVFNSQAIVVRHLEFQQMRWRINGSQISFINTTEGNTLNDLKFQLYSSVNGSIKEYLLAINGSGPVAGKVTGDYVHTRATGEYFLRLGANGTYMDSIFAFKAYLENGKTYHYEYDCKKASASEYVSDNFKFYPKDGEVMSLPVDVVTKGSMGNRNYVANWQKTIN